MVFHLCQSWGLSIKDRLRSKTTAVCTCVLGCVQRFAAPWIVARQAPLPMEFSRQEYWSGLPFPSPVALPNPGIGGGAKMAEE